MIGFYILTVSASLLLVKDTKKRLVNLKNGKNSIKFAGLTFAIVVSYVVLAYPFFETIPILNWSWLGYNIALGPFADQGFWGVLPFIPLLLYMFIHINYLEELYFRKSKKMVLAWAFIHIAMGIKVHIVIMLIPIGFLFKYIYDKKGVEHSYAMHFTTNILVVITLLLSFLS